MKNRVYASNIQDKFKIQEIYWQWVYEDIVYSAHHLTDGFCEGNAEICFEWEGIELSFYPTDTISIIKALKIANKLNILDQSKIDYILTKGDNFKFLDKKYKARLHKEDLNDRDIYLSGGTKYFRQ